MTLEGVSDDFLSVSHHKTHSKRFYLWFKHDFIDFLEFDLDLRKSMKFSIFPINPEEKIEVHKNYPRSQGDNFRN